jgi:hypothetical protein
MAQPVLIPPMRPVSAASRARYAHKQLAQGLGGLASEQLGDLEFRYFLDPVLSNDPIARFGYDPERFRVMGYRELDSDAAYAPAPAGRDLSDAFGVGNYYGYRDIYNEGPMSGDRVYVTPHYLSSPDVIAHEFRHRGIQQLHSEFVKDPDKFRQAFDPEVVEAVESYRRGVMSTPGFEEGLVEYYDNPDAPLEGRFATMAETLERKTPGDVRSFQQHRGTSFGKRVYPAASGLERGAQQALSRDPDAGGPRTGEPPRAKYREPGILDSIRRGIGALFGG